MKSRLSYSIPSTCLLVFFLMMPFSAKGQVRADVGIDFIMGIPQADFSDQLDDLGFGIEVSGAVGLKGLPVMFGADLGVMIYGHERRYEPFSQTIPDVTVKVVTDNNIAKGHLFLRLQPDSPRFRPYADALIGFKHLFTQTKITNDGFEEYEIARSTNFDDTTISYGMGAGLQIRVYNASEDGRDISNVYLNFGVQYLPGGEAEYLREGSIRRENGRLSFDVTRSKTTLLVPKFGVVVSL